MKAPNRGVCVFALYALGIYVGMYVQFSARCRRSAGIVSEQYR
jgi:hypothetical protein